MTTIFGSCRVDIPSGNKLNEDITYTHCTKEVIQLINYIHGHLKIPYPLNRFCFRDGIINHNFLSEKKAFRFVFQHSDICLVEICSIKKYMIGPFYLHSLAVDTRVENYKFTPAEILENCNKIIQSPEEIERDILEIQRLIHPRKLILVSHYNAMLGGKIIPSRNYLIQLLEHIACKHSIPFINPTEVLKEYKQEDVMQEDLGHYTDLGKEKVFDYIENFIKEYRLMKI